MATNLGDVLVQLGLDSSQYNRGLQDAGNQLDKFGNSAQKIAGTLGLIFGTREVIRFANESGRLAARFENVNKTFQTLGITAGELREATGGAVSEFKLLQRAVQASNLGLPVEELGNLFRFATLRAAETGESVDFLVNSIVTGIGRKSPLILDNLGISTVRLRNALKETGDFALAVSKIIQEETASSVLVVEEAVTEWDKLGASIENASLAIGQFLNNSAQLEGVLGFINNTLGALTEEFTRFQQGTAFQLGDDELQRTFDAVSNNLQRLENSTTILRNIPGIGEPIKQRIALLQEAKRELGEELDLRRRIANNPDVQKQLASIDALEQKLLAEAAAREEAAAAYERYLNSLQVFTELPVSLEDQVDAFIDQQQLEAAIEEFNSTLDEWANNPDNFVSIEDFIAFESDRLAQEAIDFANAAAAGVEDVEEAVNELDGAIQAFLAGSFSSLGTAIGDAFSDAGNFGQKFLESVAAFLKQFGEQLIAFGVAKTAFENPAIPGPVQIAAGVALVAAAQAIKNTLSKSKQAAKGQFSGGGFASGVAGGFGVTRANASPDIFLGDRKVNGAFERLQYRQGVAG